MTLELVICIHCGFKFRTDIRERIKKGETTVHRFFIFSLHEDTSHVETVDIVCPHCKKIFEQKV